MVIRRSMLDMVEKLVTTSSKSVVYLVARLITPPVNMQVLRTYTALPRAL